MIRQRIGPMIQWFKRIVMQPRNELDRWQRAVRFAYDLGRYGARQLRRDRAPQMAAALAFRTLFGLLPVLVVATILVKAIKGIDGFQKLMGDLFASAGFYEVRIILPSEDGPEAQPGGVTLGHWLDGLVTHAANINLAAIGWVGLAVLTYAAIGLMVTIENSFNLIYHTPEGRPWTRRIPLSWFVLTVGPVALVLTMYLDNLFGSWIESVDVWHWALVTGRVLWSLLLGWTFMVVVYTLVPNTTVAFRPALAGAFVAASLLEVGKWTMGAYLENAFSISQLYGSLGLIPLFLFWVYLTWLMVLFGLEVSATLQMLGGRKLDDIERPRQPTGIVDPDSVLVVMEVVAEHFNRGRPTTARQVTEATSIPEVTVVRMLDRLIEAAFLHRLDRVDGAVALARPPEQVSADQLIEIGFGMVDDGRVGRRSALADRLRQAQKSLAAQATLAALAPPGPPIAESHRPTGLDAGSH